MGRFLHAVTQTPPPDLEIELREINGVPALLLLSGGRPDSVMSLDVTEDGRIAGVHIQRNPDKLGALQP